MYRCIPGLMGRWIDDNEEQHSCQQLHSNDIQNLVEECRHTRPYGDVVGLTPKIHMDKLYKKEKSDWFSRYNVEQVTDYKTGEDVGKGVCKGYKAKTVLKSMANTGLTSLMCLLYGIQSLTDCEVTKTLYLSHKGKSHYNTVSVSE